MTSDGCRRFISRQAERDRQPEVEHAGREEERHHLRRRRRDRQDLRPRRRAGGSAEVAVLDATDETFLGPAQAGRVRWRLGLPGLAVPDRDQRCLDALPIRRRRVPSLHSFAEARGSARANRQPTAASYSAPEFGAFKLDVLRLEGGRIAEITTFGTSLFPAFGLPPTL
jgi:hypothetical protein